MTTLWTNPVIACCAILVILYAWFLYRLFVGEKADDQRRAEDEEQARIMRDLFQDTYKDGERPTYN